MIVGRPDIPHLEQCNYGEVTIKEYDDHKEIKMLLNDGDYFINIQLSPWFSEELEITEQEAREFAEKRLGKDWEWDYTECPSCPCY